MCGSDVTLAADWWRVDGIVEASGQTTSCEGTDRCVRLSALGKLLDEVNRTISSKPAHRSC